MPALDEAEYIIGHAERLVKLAIMCTISFGLLEGLNEALKADGSDGDWEQAVLGFRDGTQMIAVVRAVALLDRDDSKLSFQTVHRRLKSEDVRTALKAALADKYGDDDYFPPSRDQLIATFFNTYAEIDWGDVHGRLVHLRNLGVAHLTVERVSKSITFDELRALVSTIARLAIVLQQLCHTGTAFHATMLEAYRDRARATVLEGLPPHRSR